MPWFGAVGPLFCGRFLYYRLAAGDGRGELETHGILHVSEQADLLGRETQL